MINCVYFVHKMFYIHFGRLKPVILLLVYWESIFILIALKNGFSSMSFTNTLDFNYDVLLFEKILIKVKVIMHFLIILRGTISTK